LEECIFTDAKAFSTLIKKTGRRKAGKNYFDSKTG
jgi:hypothetical protein